MASLRSAYDPRNAEIAVFPALLHARKEYGGKKIALHDADDRQLSYDDIVRAAFALGHALKKGTKRGEAIGLMLPHVIRFNAENEAARLGYAELASAPEIACVSEGVEQAVEALIGEIQTLLELAKMPATLGECGVKQKDLPMLAAESAKQWTATFNPRVITEKDFLTLYEAAF